MFRQSCWSEKDEQKLESLQKVETSVRNALMQILSETPTRIIYFARHIQKIVVCDTTVCDISVSSNLGALVGSVDRTANTCKGAELWNCKRGVKYSQVFQI